MLTAGKVYCTFTHTSAELLQELWMSCQSLVAHRTVGEATAGARGVCRAEQVTSQTFSKHQHAILQSHLDMLRCPTLAESMARSRVCTTSS